MASKNNFLGSLAAMETRVKAKSPRLCLDVGIGAQTMELELDFLNTDVWMYMELRLGIEDPIPWY